MIRAIPPELDPQVVAQIDATLEAIRAEQGVAIPLAIESGSRAWGFPSPDSDYDARFLYVRRQADYMSLWPARDVIEVPIDGLLDVNGWDVAKALKLLLNGNAVVLEWLQSPIIYGADPQFRAEWLDFAKRHSDRARLINHYLHVGRRQRNLYLADPSTVPLKKLFYVLRPSAALRWLRLHPNDRVAPMNFQVLMAQCDPPPTITDLYEDLLARKALTREMGAGPVPRELLAFMNAELDVADEPLSFVSDLDRSGVRAEADALFRSLVTRFG